jgi:hypothetical protein
MFPFSEVKFSGGKIEVQLLTVTAVTAGANQEFEASCGVGWEPNAQ